MRYFLVYLIIFIFYGCSNKIPTLEERRDPVLKIAKKNNFQEENIVTSEFTIFSLQNQSSNCQNKTLKIFIEGDGLSWISRYKISDDPTPIKSTILQLIYEDSSQCKLYLARPCQFVKGKNCDKKYWTSHRFSQKIINSFDESLEILKNKYKNRDFLLVGHSGGGAVATLVASQRDDIASIITIAGNLDIEEWTDLHKISKLEESLNPADYTKNLENIPQIHLIGNKDKIIPKEIFLSYYKKFKNKNNISYKYFDEKHSCCWHIPYKNIEKFYK